MNYGNRDCILIGYLSFLNRCLNLLSSEVSLVSAKVDGCMAQPEVTMLFGGTV